MTDPQPDECGLLATQRTTLKCSINEIANDIGMALRDAGLHIPVFITVRDSGDSLATIATPLDPTDDEWSKASAIACKIIGERVGCHRLSGRELTCAVANAAIAAADVTSDQSALSYLAQQIPLPVLRSDC